MSVKKKITFAHWINEQGVIALSKKLEINPSAIRHWRRAHSCPRSEQMGEIKKLSKGRITYDMMIDPYLARLASLKKKSKKKTPAKKTTQAAK